MPAERYSVFQLEDYNRGSTGFLRLTMRRRMAGTQDRGGAIARWNPGYPPTVFDSQRCL